MVNIFISGKMVFCELLFVSVSVWCVYMYECERAKTADQERKIVRDKETDVEIIKENESPEYFSEKKIRITSCIPHIQSHTQLYIIACLCLCVDVSGEKSIRKKCP